MREWVLRAGVLAVILGAGASAQELCTTNQGSLAHFYGAIASSNRPITVVSFGDSMAASYNSITCKVINRLASTRLGIAGYSFNGGGKCNLLLTNGAAEVGPSSFWPLGHYQIPPGGTLQWDWQVSWGTGIYGDTIGIFWVAHPAGGPFRMTVSTNGGPWGSLLALDGYAPVPTGCFTNISLPLTRYRIGADGLAGTNVILGPFAVNSQSHGVHISYADRGGIALSQVTNVPVSVRGSVFKALAPDLLVWHIKEDASDATLACLRENEDWWSAWVPGCDILYIGTPYGAPVNGGEAASIGQNTIVRQVALERHRAYVDCMTPGISYQWQVSQGYMNDGVHLSDAGATFFGNVAWNDMGFFAIGLDHHLAVTRTATGPRLQWNTSAAAIYDLEASADLASWGSAYTVAGTGSPATYDPPPGPPRQFYRLKFRAP